MKANSTKRKIFDAVDLLTEDTSSQMPVKTMKGGVTMLDIDSIKPFHNHPFHLYEGDRLDDMVESIRDHGILTVVDHIVPHRGDQKLFWDRGNWQPLCEHHHNVKTMTEDRYVEYKF